MKKSSVLFAILLLVLGCSSTGKNNKAEVITPEKVTKQAETTAPTRQDDAATVLVNTVVEHIHKLPNKRLTVTDFTDIDGGESEIGKLISEKITTKIQPCCKIYSQDGAGQKTKSRLFFAGDGAPKFAQTQKNKTSKSAAIQKGYGNEKTAWFHDQTGAGLPGDITARKT
jgi:hypothetical protein